MFNIRRIRELSADERRTMMCRAERQVEEAMGRSKAIIDDVRARGDDALLDYTLRFDKVRLSKDRLKVTAAEMDKAYEAIDPMLLKAIRHAHRNILRFHKRQMPKPFTMEMESGVKAGRLVQPVDSAGLYVPGGKAVYPSVMMMLAVPADVAGVRRVVACTPPREGGALDPASLIAADLCGVNELYKVGGVQSIAAMAYGTKTIGKVDVIAGPGSPYVSAAQRLVKLDVRMDFPAGPSEGMVLADSFADPRFVAADVLSESEHGPDSAGILITDSMELAKEASEELSKMLKTLPEPRLGYVEANTRSYSLLLVADSMDDAIGFVNDYAAEHLVINTRNPEKTMKRIKNAGTICLGQYTPITAGNFIVGPNAILPTGRYARQFSGVSVDTFIKKPTFEKLTRQGLKRLAQDIELLAEFEGFPAHRNSVKARFQGG